MNRLTSCAMCVAWALVAHANTLDRIAVTIGRHVISEHDVVQDIRLSAFLDSKAPDFSGPQKRKSADRLIDQYLVLLDAAATRATLASPADAAPLLVPIKARYPSDAEYRKALAQAGITEDELSNHLLAGLRLLRYTDLRFRPEAQVSEDAMRAYFSTLTSQASDGKPAAHGTFEENRPQIEKLLTDQQVLQSLDRWLGMTRSETRILYRDAVFKDAATP